MVDVRGTQANSKEPQNMGRVFPKYSVKWGKKATRDWGTTGKTGT